MKLLKSIMVFALVLSTSVSCAQWGKGKKIKGNGNVTTITRSTASYDGIKASGFMNINLVKGAEGKITLEGESNLLDYIETHIKNDYLIIKVKDGFNLKTSRTLSITVPYEDIELVALSGSGDVNNSGTISSNMLEISLAGSGDMNLNIESQSLESNISGSGDIRLSGSTTVLNVKVAGSGDFDGRKLNSSDVDVSVAGSGNASVVCNGNLKARVSGSGNIKYKGSPKTKDTKVSGSGSISQ
jgi:hypothetical protein